MTSNHTEVHACDRCNAPTTDDGCGPVTVSGWYRTTNGDHVRMVLQSGTAQVAERRCALCGVPSDSEVESRLQREHEELDAWRVLAFTA